MKYLMLLSALALFSGNIYAAKVRKCSNSETADVKAAKRFLKQNIGTILADPSVRQLTKRNKRRIKRKLGLRATSGVVIKCMDDRRICNDERLFGMERALFNRRILLCYQNIKERRGSTAFCALADTILHEIGHASGVKKGPNHNDGPNGDLVYRLGDAAENLCSRRGLNRSIR